LVVVHAERRVVARPRLGMEHRVGGKRAENGMAAVPQLGDGRCDDVGLLAARTVSSPACGLRPAIARRGRAISKSRFSAASVISAVSTMLGRSMAPGTCAIGIWTVNGTTRSSSLASIITARVAPVSFARKSVWPGNAKPVFMSTALLIGAVATAPASPSSPSLRPAK